MRFVFIQIKTQMVATYSFSAKNPSGVEFNRLISYWVIKMKIGIIQNTMRMIKIVMRIENYGESNQVLTRRLYLSMEGEKQFML